MATTFLLLAAVASVIAALSNYAAIPTDVVPASVGYGMMDGNAGPVPYSDNNVLYQLNTLNPPPPPPSFQPAPPMPFPAPPMPSFQTEAIAGMDSWSAFGPTQRGVRTRKTLRRRLFMRRRQ